MKHKSFLIILLLLLAIGVSAIARAQGSIPTEANAPVGTSFTYQGQLKDASGPVSGNCDFKFSLWDALTDGAQVGTTLEQPNVLVSEGYFTVQLDFGANAFNGSARWLETAVRCPAGGGAYNPLLPRQPLTPAPYALYSANTDTLDGQHASAFQQHIQNLLVVAKSGGDFNTITDALNSITTNSADNPFTIYIAPGVYTETITMKPYVDIEGAGERATKITFTSNSTITSTLTGADNTELRFLTIENTGGGVDAVAILNSAVSPSLTHVTANTSGGTSNYGVYNHHSSPTMTNMTITTSGGVSSHNYSVYNTSSSSPMMTNVSATALGGVYNIGVFNSLSSPIMTIVSVITSGGVNSTNYGVYNLASSAPVMTSVIASASSGLENCGVSNYFATPTMNYVTATASGGYYSFGVYNNSSTLKMTNVIARASDATDVVGVYNLSSSVLMTDVTASALDGTDSNWGVYNRDSSQPMLNVTASSSGGQYSYGVYNESSSPVMTNVIATGSEGTNGYGMWNTNSSPTIQNSVMKGEGSYTGDGIHNSSTVSGSYTLEVNNSQINGGSSTIYSDSSDYTTKVGSSQLVGNGGMGPGHYICVLSYDGNYSPISNSCQP